MRYRRLPLNGHHYELARNDDFKVRNTPILSVNKYAEYYYFIVANTQKNSCFRSFIVATMFRSPVLVSQVQLSDQLHKYKQYNNNVWAQFPWQNSALKQTNNVLCIIDPFRNNVVSLIHNRTLHCQDDPFKGCNYLGNRDPLKR